MTTAGWPPGWYPDPWGRGSGRWWDGQAWTQHLLRRPGPADPETLARLVRAELRVLPWASAATAVAGTAALVYLVVVLAIGTRVVTVHEVVRQPTNGMVLAWSTGSNGGTPAYGFLVGVVQLACLAVFLVWQSRAAVVGRAAGYPARHSPGWGVGSWFVPVAYLWVPFQAIEDCLPPGAVGRGQVWLIMAGWVSGASIGWIGLVSALVGGGGERLVIGTALETAAIAMAWLTVLRVGRAHRALTGSTPGG